MHEETNEPLQKKLAEQVVERKTQGNRSAVGILNKLYNLLDRIAGDNKFLNLLKKNKDQIRNILEVKTLEWISGKKDRLFTSKKSAERDYHGNLKPSQIIINADFFKIEGARGFLKKVEAGNFDAKKLGDGEDNTAFSTEIGDTKIVVRYPNRESGADKKEPFFGPNCIDNYVVLRYISEKTSVKIPEIHFATRSIMVMGLLDGKSLLDYFEENYGEDYHKDDAYKQDDFYIKLESIRSEIQESIRAGIRDGSFDVLDNPNAPKDNLDLTHGNFIIDEETNDLILFDPLSGMSSGF